MKKSFRFLGGYLIGCLLVSVTMLTSCSSCNDKGSIFGNEDGVTQEYVDSVVAANIQNLVNPVFTEVDAVLAFKSLAIEGEAIDEAFNELSDDIIKNVATVCIKREGRVSKRGIVYEYRSNPGIYDNLPTPESDTSTKIGQPDSATKSQIASTAAGGISYSRDSVIPGEIRYSQKDTIINGQKYKVRLRTEVMYEKESNI